jgi:hypothetical protein
VCFPSKIPANLVKNKQKDEETQKGLKQKRRERKEDKGKRESEA